MKRGWGKAHRREARQHMNNDMCSSQAVTVGREDHKST